VGPSWRTRDVWAIAGSAFFADLGYQAVMAAFPLYLVLRLHAPVVVYGLAAGLAYGGGALLGYLGGRLGERFGLRRVTLAGNLGIPLLSLCALPGSVPAAVVLLCAGWWCRSIRSPTRRAMLTAAVPRPAERAAAFGFLHALDVGGATLAGLGALGAVAAGVPYRWLFLATVVPLLASSACLALAHPPEPARRRSVGAAPGAAAAAGGPTAPAPAPGAEPVPVTGPSGATAPGGAGAKRPAPGAGALPALGLLLAATAVFGISSYSLGFPVLDVARARGAVAADGVGAFVVVQAASSATGYLLGPRLAGDPRRRVGQLAAAGYGLAGLASAGLAVGGAGVAGLPLLLASVAVLGVALGVVETLEPALVSDLARQRSDSRAFGALSGARGSGVLVGNLAVGGLFAVGAEWGFTYAAATAVGAGCLLLAARALGRRRGEPAVA